MKPNFALSLSSDGISLLHDSAGEWVLVGDVDVQSPTLADDLADLRRKAEEIEPGGLRCKLVIPEDQIKYLTLETPGKSAQDRRAAAAAALEGATPYRVSDLTFDISQDGAQTHVAAVANETIAEAESFARDHDLTPVSFVGRPEATQFEKEPFFGKATSFEAAPVAETPDRAAIPPAPPITSPTERPAPDAYAEAPDTPTETPSDAPPSVDFVSRRTVPTFRTRTVAPQVIAGFNEAAEGAVPGFGEAETPFEGQKTRQAGSSPKRPKNAVPAPTGLVTAPDTEADRLTVFGARKAGALPGALGPMGLSLVAVAVVFAGLLAFAGSVMESGFSGLFAKATPPAAQFTAPLQPEVPQALETVADENPTIELVALERTLSDEDAAVLDALRTPIIAEPVIPDPPSPQDLRTHYAVTGIWAIAPEVPLPPAAVDLEDLYVTSIDPINQNFDAVALPTLQSLESDVSFRAPASPAPAGTRFVLDDKGMVVPTPEGSLNPDGVTVFAGPPPARQPDTMLRIEDPGEDLATRMLLAGFRPISRPENLIETTERATLGGLTKTELALLRPRLRPQSAQENARSASLVQLDNATGEPLLSSPGDENDFDGATARAVAASLRPDARPNNFSAIVARTQRAAPAPQTVSTASVTPRAITPKIPSSASAAREATMKNAINLRQVNLIGVYGKPSARRALVRLGNGRYRKVKVGDPIDGGQVSAIGDAELRYQKRGRAIVLKMPRG